MTQNLLFGSGTGIRFSHRGTAMSPSAPTDGQKGGVAVTLVCHLARTLIRSPRKDRHLWRQVIRIVLQKARVTERPTCIDRLLRVFISEGGPDGLDDAIDILATTGAIVLDYAWEYLQRDIELWNSHSERAYRPNDDYWYVLLRAVARSNRPERDRLRLILCCASAQSRGVREGVVEALRDLDTPAAHDRLRKFAAHDEDGFIRDIAREALEDRES